MGMRGRRKGSRNHTEFPRLRLDQLFFSQDGKRRLWGEDGGKSIYSECKWPGEHFKNTLKSERLRETGLSLNIKINERVGWGEWRRKSRVQVGGELRTMLGRCGFLIIWCLKNRLQKDVFFPDLPDLLG